MGTIPLRRRGSGPAFPLGEGLSHETIAGAVLRAMIAHPVPPLTRGLGPCSLLLLIKRCILDWRDSGPGKSGATHYCKENGAPRHPATLPKPEDVGGDMPRKSAAELEAECLRLLAMDPHTRGIKRVEIIRIYPKGTGPNWTYGALDPMPKRAGLAIAQTLIASVYGR
jgi:hypothetical protein